VIPKLPTLYDEPFADLSQVPTFLVAQLARRSVTVALSGDGGDELFGGYNRYLWAPPVMTWMGRAPSDARELVAKAILSIRPSIWDAWFARIRPLLPAAANQRLPGDKMHKLARVLAARDGDVLYRQLLSTWQTPTSVLVEGTEYGAPCDDRTLRVDAPDLVDRMMLTDSLMYLPDDILVKLDRAAMGVSLETRVPMLDPKLVAFAWSLPKQMKIRKKTGKFILREVLAQYVPRAMFERPKMGFGVPLADWLRGPLRDWAEPLLSEDRLRADGMFKPEPIGTKWQQHISGERNWQYDLWLVLMFQCWMDHWRDPPSPALVSTGQPSPPDGLLL
jgi:asparagine synthase (glutamine-hydrolysing)